MNSILFKFQENNIKMTFQSGPTTWNALNGKPVPTEENSFVVADEDLEWTWITLAEAQALLGGQGTDEKVKYDSADPASGYLSAKVIAGTNISITEGTGADENKVKISFTGTIPSQLSDLSSDADHQTVSSTEKSTWNGKIANIIEDITPQLGGDLDVNGKSTDWGAIISTNGTYKGDTLNVTVDTNGTGFSAVLAQGADFHFDLADADAVANCYMVAIALEAGTGTKKVLTKGQVCNTSWNWSAGPVFLSTTDGGLTQTAPSGTDDVVMIVGWALSATVIFFDPYASFIEHT